MSDPTPRNRVLSVLWTNRNAMQRVNEISAVGGLAIGILGFHSSVAVLLIIGSTAGYALTTSTKGFKRIALTVGAFGLTFLSSAIFAGIGTGLTGKDTSKPSTPSASTITPKTTDSITPLPAPKPIPAPVSIPEPVAQDWKSESARRELEQSIKEDFSLQMTGANIVISSVQCRATDIKLIWNCDIRPLGEPEPIPYRIEVSEEGDTWAGQPL